MQVSGLGYLPDDVWIKALNCDARWLGGNDNHNATCNFWRGVENLHVGSTVMWAVSQAAFMRRVHITGLLYLHDNNGWAGGGFLSDSLIEGMVDSGSQQQWLSRNCNWNGWRGSNWNIVFAGIEKGKAPKATWPEKQYTNVENVEEMREKPDIKIHHVIAVMITGNPGITHVLNELGGPMNTPGARDIVIEAGF